MTTKPAAEQLLAARLEVEATIPELRELHEFIEPLGTRVLVTKPKGAGRAPTMRRRGSILIPIGSEVVARERGVICRVLRVGNEVMHFKPGDSVLLAEFGGVPVYNDTDETSAWVVDESQVLARVTPDYWQAFGSDEPESDA